MKGLQHSISELRLRSFAQEMAQRPLHVTEVLRYALRMNKGGTTGPLVLSDEQGLFYLPKLILMETILKNKGE